MIVLNKHKQQENMEIQSCESTNSLMIGHQYLGCGGILLEAFPPARYQTAGMDDIKQDHGR